jgi:hypothetical protein
MNSYKKEGQKIPDKNDVKANKKHKLIKKESVMYSLAKIIGIFYQWIGLW